MNCGDLRLGRVHMMQRVDRLLSSEINMSVSRDFIWPFYRS